MAGVNNTGGGWLGAEARAQYAAMSRLRSTPGTKLALVTEDGVMLAYPDRARLIVGSFLTKHMYIDWR